MKKYFKILVFLKSFYIIFPNFQFYLIIKMEKLEKFYFYFLFLTLIFFGLYIRFEDINLWQRHKDLFFYKKSPIYSEYDSYYFARLSLDFKEGKFKPGLIDNYRFFPDNSSKAKLDEDNKFYAEYNIPGNFLSIIWAYLSEWFGISLETLTWYLVPLLSVLVALPLFLYLKEMGYPYAGLIGGLVAVSAPMYFFRTNLMRLDHDMLNLFFPIFIAYAFYKFFKAEERRKKYVWIIISSFILILYQLWYGHSNLNFVLIIMFLLRYIWDKKLNWRKEDFLFISLLILPQIWYIYSGPFFLYKQIKTLVFNIKSPTSAEVLFKDFPNIFLSISELQKVGFTGALEYVISNLFLGIVGLIGVCLFFLLNLRNTIFLLPFFGIGLLSFFSGVRFTMYLAPFIGIGIGHLVSLFFNKFIPYFNFRYSKGMNYFIGVLIFILIIWIQRPVLGFSSFPKVISPLVRDMDYLRENTPKNSAIWSWWDYGYAFQLYSRRATFHDGGSQGTPKTYFIAKSFVTHDPVEAWYITSFISNYGLTGIAKLLKEGISAKDLVNKVIKGEYAKEIKIPIYWVFTLDLISKFGWIHYIGSYDFDSKEGKFGKIIEPDNCKLIGKNFIGCENGKISIDLNNGVITTPQGLANIHYFYFKAPDKVLQKKFFDSGYIVEMVKSKNNQTQIFILEPSTFHTLFNQMFILRNYDSRYFDLVLDDFPYMVIYKVKMKI